MYDKKNHATWILNRKVSLNHLNSYNKFEVQIV